MSTEGRIIKGVKWDWHEGHSAPKVGDSVYMVYERSHGGVHAEIEKPTNCAPSDIAEGVVRQRWSPNNNSFWLFNVEVTAEFPPA